MTAKPVPEHISDERLAELRSYARLKEDACLRDEALLTAKQFSDFGRALTELQHRREAEAGGWSRSEAPLERFVLVRPIGLHHSGEPFTPTVAQCLDWSGTRRWYTPMNEIEPIEFGESIEQDGLPDNLRFHGTEWRYLPDDPALAASPSSPASGVRVSEEELIKLAGEAYDKVLAGDLPDLNPFAAVVRSVLSALWEHP